MINIIQKRVIWLTFSGLLVTLSIASILIWGLKFGIDFTGGSLLEVKFIGERPSVSVVMENIKDLDAVQPVDEDRMILRFQDITEERHQEVLLELNKIVGGIEDGDEIVNKENEELKDPEIDNNKEDEGNENEEKNSTSEVVETEDFSEKEVVVLKVEELRFDSVGATIGKELETKSINALIVVLIAIVLYIAWVFRQVSKPVSSWKYGITAIIALFHDVIIVVGIFAYLGHRYGIEINTPFIAAILTVLGYSVNDTIVMFDRIRENLPKSSDDFETTVNTSVNQTIRRSVNTSLTTLLVLGSILFFGGATIKSFVLALSIGILIGTYSSIFLASPILVVWEKAMRKN